MKTKPHDRTSEERRAGEKAAAGIIDETIRQLGKPDDLFTVHVRHLWGDHYRVNVFRGESIVSAAIAHSYFLKVDSAGAILAASPPIVRQYQQ